MEVGYLPDMFGHVAQMPQLLAAVRLRARRRVARRARRRSTQRRSGGRRPTARRCGPSTCRSGYGNGAVAARRRQGARRAGSTSSCREQGDLRRRPGALDERHRPPAAPAVARPGRGRGQRPPGRLPPRGHLAGRPRRGRPHRRPARVAGRAAVGRARQPAHGRGVEPRRRASRPRRAPSGRSSGWPSRWPRCSCPADRWPAALPRRGVAAR